MMTSGPKRRSACPISASLDLIGDKWTLLILRDLAFKHKRYFRDFLNSEEKIATNILAGRLRNLEQAAIVTRQPDPGNARQVIYALTEKGIDLIPLLIDLMIWGASYDPKTKAPQEFIERALVDRNGLVAELRRTILDESIAGPS